jgi:multiple sugar transport system ATP-binding protein
MTLANRIAVLSAGHKMQYDTPDGIYNRPAALFVAGFTGAPPMNLMDVNINAGIADLGNGSQITLPARLAKHGGACKLGIRPENLRLVAEPGDICITATVSLLEPLGSETLVSFKVGMCEMIARLAASFSQQQGTVLMLQINPAHLHLFNAQNGAALI